MMRASWSSGIEQFVQEGPRPTRKGYGPGYVFPGRADFGECRPEEE